MGFESTVEGRVRVDGADRSRKTVPHIRAADREGPSSELGPSSLYRGCSGRRSRSSSILSSVDDDPRCPIHGEDAIFTHII